MSFRKNGEGWNGGANKVVGPLRRVWQEIYSVDGKPGTQKGAGLVFEIYCKVVVFVVAVVGLSSLLDISVGLKWRMVYFQVLMTR